MWFSREGNGVRRHLSHREKLDVLTRVIGGDIDDSIHCYKQLATQNVIVTKTKRIDEYRRHWGYLIPSISGERSSRLLAFSISAPLTSRPCQLDHSYPHSSSSILHSCWALIPGKRLRAHSRYVFSLVDIPSFFFSSLSAVVRSVSSCSSSYASSSITKIRKRLHRETLVTHSLLFGEEYGDNLFLILFNRNDIFIKCKYKFISER